MKIPQNYLSRCIRVGVLALVPLFISMDRSDAALIWSADFESYDTSEGPVAVTFNTSGADDTFRNVSTPLNISNPIYEVRGTGVPEFMGGNALYLAGTGSGGNGTLALRINQSSLPATTTVYVVSYDELMVGDSYNLSNQAREGSSSAGSASSLGGITSPLRVTFVMNLTGSDITLPGSMGTLASGFAITYRYDGTTFVAANATSITKPTLTGFEAGFTKGTTTGSYAGWFDNFGVWDSITDTVAGVNVLELAPGMNPIPEPSTAAMLLGVGAFAWLIRSKKARA